MGFLRARGKVGIGRVNIYPVECQTVSILLRGPVNLKVLVNFKLNNVGNCCSICKALPLTALWL